MINFTIMQGSSPDFFSNPTTQRLGWIRNLFFEQVKPPTTTSALKRVESSDLVPKPGVLLVAPPMVHDLNFRRSVILVCEHSPEGSFGLILNHQLGVHLAQVIPGFDGGDVPIGKGGPVQTDTLHFIHRRSEDVPDAIPVARGVYWGGDFDVMKLLIETGEVLREDVRFFLGYAGWSPGQLLREIDQGGWILVPGGDQAVFGEDSSDLWRSVLRTMGGEYAVLANFPEDPRLN